jgi:hypothetical protein
LGSLEQPVPVAKFPAHRREIHAQRHGAAHHQLAYPPRAA